jgi:hypothetical protein
MQRRVCCTNTAYSTNVFRVYNVTIVVKKKWVAAAGAGPRLLHWLTWMIGAGLASRRGITYSLVQHHNNGQNSSDNNVMPLKPRDVNAVIAGNVADIYKGDEGM